jgi:hypothetical protein
VRPAAAVALTAVLAGGALLPASSGADSFTPVRLAISIAPVARLRAPLRVTVGVSADPGVLDGSEGPMRIGVKLAGECGGSFQTTPGDTLLNHQLSPQPATGRAYAATARGWGRPTAYGVQTVCVYLEDTDVGRVYANSESDTVAVSRACTARANRYEAAERALTRARRRLRRARRGSARRAAQRAVTRDERTAARDRGAARRACGRGVPL